MKIVIFQPVFDSNLSELGVSHLRLQEKLSVIRQSRLFTCHQDLSFQYLVWSLSNFTVSYISNYCHLSQIFIFPFLSLHFLYTYFLCSLHFDCTTSTSGKQSWLLYHNLIRLRAPKLKEAISTAVKLLSRRLIPVALKERRMELVEGWENFDGTGFQERLVGSHFIHRILFLSRSFS